MSKTLSWLTVVSITVASGLGAQENPPEQSRFRRANGTLVVKATAGSIPYDGEHYAPAAVPLVRDHYLWPAEWMADARAEAYVDAEVQDGFWLGSNVGTPDAPIMSRAPNTLVNFDGLNRSTAGFNGKAVTVGRVRNSVLP